MQDFHSSDGVKCFMNNYSLKFLSFWLSSFCLNILIYFFNFYWKSWPNYVRAHLTDTSWTYGHRFLGYGIDGLLYVNNEETEGWILPCDRFSQSLWLTECNVMTRQVQCVNRVNPSLSLVKKLKKLWGFGVIKSQTGGVPLSAQQSQEIPWAPFFSLIFI